MASNCYLHQPCQSVIFYLAVKTGLLILLTLGIANTEMVKMKIVEEPSNYGMNSYQFANQYHNEEKKLTMRVKPSNFSGPEHLRRLVGKCFTKETDVYKYEFCPFSNVSQFEQSFRWNPFIGILGVWQEWEIINNTFTAMVLREGEKCGEIFRSIKVILQCGEKHEIRNVTEPNTCNYHMYFGTPYVCHQHSMLVYPTLSEELQEKWDLLEGELHRQEITQKGYNKQLRKIFEKAGYYMTVDEKKVISMKAVQDEEKKKKEEKGEFDTLPKCLEEYKKLKKEVEGLRTLLSMQKDSEERKTASDDRKGGKKLKNQKSKRRTAGKFYDLVVKKISHSTNSNS